MDADSLAVHATLVVGALLFVYASARNFQVQLEYGLLKVAFNPFSNLHLYLQNPDILAAYFASLAVLTIGFYLSEN